MDFVKIISEQPNRENSSAQLLFTCPFEDRFSEYCNLIGGLIYTDGVAAYQQPAEYPFGTGLFCTGVDCEPLGDYTADGYKTAALTVSYGGLRILDPYATTGIGICEICCDGSGEAINIPSGKYQWPDGSLLTDEDTKPAMVFPILDLSAKHLFSSRPQMDVISKAFGMVNSEPFVVGEDTYAENTVLFVGCGLEHTTQAQGQPCYVHDFHFAIRYNDGLGWNGLWNTKSGKFETVTTAGSSGSGGGKPCYVSDDLNKLFDLA